MWKPLIVSDWPLPLSPVLQPGARRSAMAMVRASSIFITSLSPEDLRRLLTHARTATLTLFNVTGRGRPRSREG
jgi:hypothetical protein